MPSIHPATISFPPTPGASGSPRDVRPLPVLIPGEVLAAEVSEKLPGGRLLLTLKNVTVAADSAVPLTAGAKLMVKVEQVEPRIVLSLIENEALETAIINDFLTMKRAHPDALMTLISEAGELLNPQNLGALSRALGGKDIHQLLGLLGKMIFSPHNLEDPLFLKDFISRLGLLWESDLKKAVQDPSREADFLKGRDNLKALLMKLSVALQAFPGEKGLPDAGARSMISRLAEFAARSVKSIEMQQVISVLAQENGSRSLLQIPLLVAGGGSGGDIFIESDGEKAGQNGSPARYAVVIFLAMDALGDMMIEARLQGKKLGCVIKCNKQETGDFISLAAGELEKKLLALGYEIDRLSFQTVAGDTVRQMKDDYLKEKNVYGREGVDFFA